MPETPKFRYDVDIRRFRDRRGRFVAQSRIAGYIDRTSISYALVVAERGKALAADPTNEQAFKEWYTQTRRELKQLHTAATIVALGGKEAALRFSNENGNAWAQSEAAIFQQLRYFDNFAYGVLNGTVNLNTMESRSAMYGLAIYSTFQNAVRIREETAGMNEELRETQSGNPCVDCAAERDKGWQPIGTLRRIGNSKCLTRCRCKFKFRKMKSQET